MAIKPKKAVTAKIYMIPITSCFDVSSSTYSADSVSVSQRAVHQSMNLLTQKRYKLTTLFLHVIELMPFTNSPNQCHKGKYGDCTKDI